MYGLVNFPERSGGPRISPAQFSELFPFHFAFDRRGVLTSVGPSVVRALPSLTVGAEINAAFTMRSPAIALEYEAIGAHIGTECVLEAVGTELVLKGKFIGLESREQLCFVGAPLAFAREGDLAASLAKGAFLATISHELRTPMNGVLGNARLLLCGELSAEQRAYAEAVLSSGEALMKVINDSLELTEIAPPTEGARIAEKGAPAPSPTVHRTRVLVVDDNPVNRTLAVKFVEKLGLRAEDARNGLEAVQAHRAHGYDLILMDCQMPEMDGFEATRTIRRLGGAHKPFIVALTANAMPGDRERCIASGMDDYLSKPLKLEALNAVLARFRAGVRP